MKFFFVEQGLLLPGPLRGMRAWRNTMDFKNSGYSPGPGPEAVERQRVAKEQAS